MPIRFACETGSAFTRALDSVKMTIPFERRSKTVEMSVEEQREVSGYLYHFTLR
jgi:hypothetical protein